MRHQFIKLFIFIVH